MRVEGIYISTVKNIYMTNTHHTFSSDTKKKLSSKDTYKRMLTLSTIIQHNIGIYHQNNSVRKEISTNLERNKYITNSITHNIYKNSKDST